MKLRLLFTVLITSLLFAACSDNNGVNFGGGTPSGGVMTASINGDGWGAPDGYVQNIAPFDLQMYGVYGQSSMTLYIMNYNGPANYPLNGNTKITYVVSGVTYTSITGYIDVYSDTDESIEGTFQCQAIGNTGSTTLDINNGNFKINRVR